MKKIGMRMVIGALALLSTSVFATCEYATVTITNSAESSPTSGGYELTYSGVGSKDSNIKPSACNATFSDILENNGDEATTLLQVGSTITLRGKASYGPAKSDPKKLVVTSSQLTGINCGGYIGDMSCNCTPSNACS